MKYLPVVVFLMILMLGVLAISGESESRRYKNELHYRDSVIVSLTVQIKSLRERADAWEQKAHEKVNKVNSDSFYSFLKNRHNDKKRTIVRLPADRQLRLLSKRLSEKDSLPR